VRRRDVALRPGHGVWLGVLASSAARHLRRGGIADATYETHYLPLRGADRTLAGVLGVGTSITERARTEVALLPLLARADLPTYPPGRCPLSLVPERVRDLVKNLAAKLGVGGRWSVVAAARERGLL